MTKEQLQQKTQEIMEFRFECMKRDMEKVINKMDADLIEAWNDDYLLPKAFVDALYDKNTEHVTSRHYSLAYTRKYQNAVRSFKKVVVESR